MSVKICKSGSSGPVSGTCLNRASGINLGQKADLHSDLSHTCGGLLNVKNPDMTLDAATFGEIELEHEELNELFLAHQEALLALDLQLASARLDNYVCSLLRHMAFEEEHLIPVYARAGTVPGGPVEFFTGEHARMREFLARFRDTIADLRSNFSGGASALRRRVIALFDAEAAYKSLVEHHHMREGNLFFPALEGAATQQEKKRLLERFRQERKS
jgi:hypothetical protein